MVVLFPSISFSANRWQRRIYTDLHNSTFNSTTIGALESFGAANVNVDFENQGDDTINEKRNLNLISHHLATRGHADGTIELF